MSFNREVCASMRKFELVHGFQIFVIPDLKIQNSRLCWTLFNVQGVCAVRHVKASVLTSSLGGCFVVQVLTDTVSCSEYFLSPCSTQSAKLADIFFFWNMFQGASSSCSDVGHYTIIRKLLESTYFQQNHRTGNLVELTGFFFLPWSCLLKAWCTHGYILDKVYTLIPLRGLSPCHGEEVFETQWPEELCWRECKPPLPDRSKGSGQMEYSPWSSRLGVECETNDPTPD